MFSAESHIDFYAQCVIMTQTKRTQRFDKIDSFLKPVLNILIVCNLILGWGEEVIKERTGILYQIYRFRGGV